MNLQEAIFRLEEERRRFTDEDRREIAAFLRSLAGAAAYTLRSPRMVTNDPYEATAPEGAD